MEEKEYVTVHHIGRNVQTIFGKGVLIDIDAGGAYWVEIGDELEQIRSHKDISLLEE